MVVVKYDIDFTKEVAMICTHSFLIRVKLNTVQFYVCSVCKLFLFSDVLKVELGENKRSLRIDTVLCRLSSYI